MVTVADQIRARSAGLQEEKFQYQQERDEQADAIKLLEQQRANALAEKTIAIKATELRQQAQQDLDATDFLKHFQGVAATDPEFEKKVATLAATYPAALRDVAVQKTLGVNEARRKDYLDATKEGGASAFPEGPARSAFQNTLTATGDVYSARAAAKVVAEGEKTVREDLRQGFLTAEDFARPEGQPLPPIFKQDGTIDYAKAGQLAAERSGKVAGKAAKAEDLELNTMQTYVMSYLKNPNALLADDPNAKELYQLYSKRLLENARKSAGGAAAPAATTPAAPAAGASKPAVVIQKGISYNLQPDGTYK